MFEKIVTALPKSLRKVKSSSAFRSGCDNEKMRQMSIAGCLAAKLREMLQETLPSVTLVCITPPLGQIEKFEN